jgi:hypothetical protein
MFLMDEPKKGMEANLNITGRFEETCCYDNKYAAINPRTNK